MHSNSVFAADFIRRPSKTAGAIELVAASNEGAAVLGAMTR